MTAISNNERKNKARRGGNGSSVGALHLAASQASGGDSQQSNGVVAHGGATSGWYPDPDDTGGLRFWDGQIWSEHRARLSLPAAPAPSHAPAICSCGVAAIGRCRLCSDAYCRSHISDVAVDDRPFRTRWEAWTCGNCIEDNQREIRALQLARCENVSLQMQRIPKLKSVRTPNGKRPPLVSLFQHPRKATERPPRYAEAFLIEYDGGPPNPRYEGLALSQDGSTVYNVGLPVTGVPKDRFGPKRNLSGYIVKNVIDVELLDEASGRSTKDSWFEFAARSFLRVAHHIGIKPDFSIVFDAPEPATADETSGDEHSPMADEAHLELGAGSDVGDESADGEPPAAADSDHRTAIEDSDAETSGADLVSAVVPSGTVIDDIDHDIQTIEVEHDRTATVQLQPPVGRQPDPPLSPPLPLPHP